MVNRSFVSRSEIVDQQTRMLFYLCNQNNLSAKLQMVKSSGSVENHGCSCSF